MKKAYLFPIIVAFVFSTISCVDPLQKPEFVLSGDGPSISLCVKSSDSPKTKATRPGDDDGTYNENRIYTLDYFIFNVDPTANTGTDAVIQGRLSFGNNGIEPTSETIAKQNAKIIDVSEKFGEGNNICYVYVIANLPDETSSPNNYFEINEDGALQQVAGTTTTVLEADYATLQAIEVVTGFKNSLTEGKKFKPQKSFVMSGLKGPITLTGTGADEAIVDVSRIASKISLDINVIKMIEQYSTNNVTQDEVYQGTWFPNVDHIQIYLNYVNPAGLVSGTYEGRKYQIGSYFSYERNAYIPTISPNGSYTSTSLARYSDDPLSPYYCGAGNEDLVGSIYVDGSGNPVLINGTQYPAFEVTGTPFYSYPTMWKTSDATAPFIKIIIPWVKYSVVESYRNLSPDSQAYKNLINAVQGFPTETTDLTYTLNETAYPVATRVTTASAMTSRYGEEFYYKISVPAFLDNPYVDNQTNETYECALFANKWYMINLDVAVLGSETDDAEMTIDGSQMGIYVVDWSTPDEDLGGNLDGGRYLSTAQKVYVIDAINSATIPVISSHTLVAEITNKKVLVNGVLQDSWTSKNANGNTITHTLTNRGTVTPNGTSSITLSNDLNSTVGPNLDCYPFVFTIRISQKNSDGTTTGSLSKVITVYQYPSIYVDAKAGGNVMIDGYYGNVGGHFHASALRSHTQMTAYDPVYGNSGTNTNGSYCVETPYAQIARYTNTQTDMTVISISALANSTFDLGTQAGGELKYLVADPRQPGGYTSGSLQPYYSGAWNENNSNTNRTQWTAEQASGILIGNTETKNFIAPKFMISSRWGRMGYWAPGNMSAADRLETVQKRCATYQEAGYPAGRWRLPTDAEIMFIAKLQQNGFISELFTSNGYSISASGDVFTVGSQSVGVNQNNGTSCRCVYDLWYWGDEPVPGAQATYTIAVK